MSARCGLITWQNRSARDGKGPGCASQHMSLLRREFDAPAAMTFWPFALSCRRATSYVANSTNVRSQAPNSRPQSMRLPRHRPPPKAHPPPSPPVRPPPSSAILPPCFAAILAPAQTGWSAPRSRASRCEGIRLGRCAPRRWAAARTGLAVRRNGSRIAKTRRSQSRRSSAMGRASNRRPARLLADSRSCSRSRNDIVYHFRHVGPAAMSVNGPAPPFHADCRFYLDAANAFCHLAAPRPCGRGETGRRAGLKSDLSTNPQKNTTS